MQVDDTLDSSWAVVILDDDSEAGFSSWGEEAVSAVFKPLQSPPQIDIKTKDNKLQLDDFDLDLNTVLMIQKRAKAKLDKNKEYSPVSSGLLPGSFHEGV